MTKRAQLADGTILEFPDDTPDAVMDRVVRQHVQGARAAQRPDWRTQAAGALANFNHGLFFGGDDEITGALAAGGRGIDAAIHGRNPIEAAGQGFQEQSANTNTLRRDFLEQHPNVGNLAQGVGMAAPAALTLGSVAAPSVVEAGAPAARGLLARTAAGRGPAAWAAQTTQGAAGGSAAGGTYGFLDAEGGFDDRINRGNEGAVFGGLLGAAAPTAVNVVRGASDRLAPLVPAIRQLLEQTPMPEANTLGAMGGNLRRRPPQPRAPTPPSIPGAAINRIDAAAHRNEMSPEDVAAAFRNARENPQGQVTADLLGDAGTRMLRPIVQAPGKSGGLAETVVHARATAMPDRILSDLNRRLRVSETPEEALASLGKQYEDASANLYRPVFARPVSTESRAGLARAFEPFVDDPVMIDAMARADRLFARDRRLGRVSGQADDNFARYAHYVKLGLDDAAKFAATPNGGAMSTELGGIRAMRRQLIEAIDQNVPGYQAARARWGGLVEAEQALEEGATLIRQNSRTIAARMAEMTPFAQYHARVGFAHEIANRLGLRGSVNGNRNVAEALGSPEMQARVAAMFDSPEQAAQFLDTLNTQNRLMRNASKWVGGSTTYSNFAHGEDNAMGHIAEAAGHAARGDPGRAVLGLGRQVGNFLSNNAIERGNDQAGAALLRQVDTPDSQAFADEVVRLLRERERGRSVAGAFSRTAGAVAPANEALRRKGERR